VCVFFSACVCLVVCLGLFACGRRGGGGGAPPPSLGRKRGEDVDTVRSNGGVKIQA
jgi:hypothetical protein